MVSIKNKIKNYKSMVCISDDGFQAIVHYSNYNDAHGNKVNAIMIYSNDNGDGVYGKPVAVIKGIDIDKIKNII